MTTKKSAMLSSVVAERETELRSALASWDKASMETGWKDAPGIEYNAACALAWEVRELLMRLTLRRRQYPASAEFSTNEIELLVLLAASAVTRDRSFRGLPNQELTDKENELVNRVRQICVDRGLEDCQGGEAGE